MIGTPPAVLCSVNARGPLKRRELLAGLVLSAWALAVTAAVLPLFASHLVVFKPGGTASAAIVPGSWSMTHVLAQACACSQTVVPYLLKRGPVDAHEKVLFFGRQFPREAELRARGFEVEVRDPATRDRSEITAVPFLMISNPAGVVVYAGGYSDHRVSVTTTLQDVALLEQLRVHADSAALPVIGCAVSAQDQARIDPFGIKRIGAE